MTTEPITPFWSMLDEPARRELRRISRPVSFRPGEAMLRQDDASQHLLVIRQGCAKVLVDSEHGYRAVLAIRGPGDLLGEQAGLNGGTRSASLYALTAVEAMVIPLSRFTAARHGYPGIAQAVPRMLSERLREADGGRAAAGAPVQARLASLVLELSARYGQPLDGPERGQLAITLPLSQDDLAGLVLSSRRTVSRILEQWRDQGMVATGRRLIQLVRPNELRELALRAGPVGSPAAGPAAPAPDLRSA
ncbi:Crp/Fnr family transcriptional regulator [Kitasatospora sp. RB6PN24]|uniref:Crp/Fnr family transcriptional regulator n=1 Tax=Kitasatospora humi TaxID=2893891 RepID=UPI001E6031A1|nr:Crp/Fnr family transcriptional regulator [Kitasatospora humi]MCC9310939.1 Crp/Fnr family transcriptional regulator [Kitasatospora humi]